MSVILDALRRARGQVPGRAASPPPGVPAALVGRSRQTRKSGGTRWALLAGVVLIAVLAWLGTRFALQWGTPVSPTMAQPTLIDPVEASLAPVISEPVAASPEPAPGDTETAATRATPPDKNRPWGPALAGPSDSQRPAPAVAPAPVLSAPVPAPPATRVTAAIDYFGLAVRYHRLGDFERALTHYTSALQADEFNVEARNNLGLLYSERGLTNEALEQFRRAILIDPQYIRARSNLAVVMLNAGRLTEARAELRAALALDPRNADLLVNLALVDLADRQPDVAGETLLRAIGLQTSHAAAHYNLAILFDEAGDVSRAQQHYSDFLKYAGPEYGTRLSAVRQRLDQLAPRLTHEH